MANTVRIKRRITGAVGAPASLQNAELAYNEVDNVLYYGQGTGGAGGSATSILAIAGLGAYLALTGNQTVAGTKIFTSTISGSVSGNAGTVTNGIYTTDIGTVSNTMLGGSIANAKLLNSNVTLGSTSIALGGTTTTLTGLTSVTATSFVGSLNGNANTATALGTARTLSITGDVSYTSPAFDGSSNVTAAATLTATGVTAGTYTKITVDAKGRATVGGTASLSELGTPTADIPLGSFKITGLADPVNAQDAATKSYVDATAQGLDAKASVKAATTANISLSGLQTIDGISLVAGDRCLVKAQTTASQNGIYIVSASAWTRASDVSAWSQVPGAFTFVEQGTTLADTGWVCNSDAGGVIGTTALTFVQFSSAGTYTNGTGLTLSGGQFSITNTAVTTGSYGSASSVATFTVNQQGQLTAAGSTSISITNTQVSGLGTMSTQAASGVAITGGSITNLATFDGVTVDGGTF